MYEGASFVINSKLSRSETRGCEHCRALHMHPLYPTVVMTWSRKLLLEDGSITRKRDSVEYTTAICINHLNLITHLIVNWMERHLLLAAALKLYPQEQQDQFLRQERIKLEIFGESV